MYDVQFERLLLKDVLPFGKRYGSTYMCMSVWISYHALHFPVEYNVVMQLIEWNTLTLEEMYRPRQLHSEGFRYDLVSNIFNI